MSVYARQCSQDYLTMLCRLFAAAHRLSTSRAALIGMWWERWSRDTKFAPRQCSQDYLTMLCRLFAAANRLSPSRAALIGMWWERWSRDTKFARYIRQAA